MCISIKSFVEIKVIDVTKLTARDGKVNRNLIKLQFKKRNAFLNRITVYQTVNSRTYAIPYYRHVDVLRLMTHE
jgi:hypothetical protein